MVTPYWVALYDKGIDVIARGKIRMPKKTTKSAISRQNVLDSAARIFRDNGYAGTTMRAVAEEANLKAGSIYYHYKSKDDLISAVLDVGIHAVSDAVKKALSELPQNTSAHDQIETAVRAHISAIIEHGEYTMATRRVSGNVPEKVRAKNVRDRRAYGTMWQNLLEKCKKRGEFRKGADITLARLFILGALNWTVEWFKPGGRTVEDTSREFAAIIINGLIK
jgi:TetR/AcrR family transcriptional regulator, cholesterol catabolism regulator